MATTYTTTNYPGVRAYSNAKGHARYEAQWRDVAGRIKTKGGFATKNEAKRHRDSEQGAKAEGRSTERSAMTYNEWWAKWWPTHEPTLCAGAQYDYARWHRLYVEPTLGTLRLVDIQPTDVKAMLADLTKRGLGKSAQKAAKSLASQVLGAAVPETAGMHANPALGVKVRDGQHVERGAHALTPAQVEVIANACAPWLARTVRAIAYGGFRPSEACGLQRRHYDAGKGVANVVEVLREVRGHVERRQTTKTHKARPVRITTTAVAADLADRVKLMTPNAPLYPRRDGTELRPAILHRSLVNVVAKLRTAGTLTGDNLPETITPYTLRHTCATILANANVPATVAARQMGHDPVEFLRTYVDVFNADLDTAADAIADAVRKAVGE